MTISYRQLKELKKPDCRRELGLAVIEGVRLVMDAQKGGIEFTALYVSKSFAGSGDYNFKRISEKFRESGSEPIILSDSLFNAVCDTKTPQGVLAVIRTVEYRIDELLAEGPKRLYVILDEINDPGNAGSIVRTAEAAGFTGVILSAGCVDLYSPKTLRASMGSALRIPVVQNAVLTEAIVTMRSSGITVFAAASDARCCYYEFDLSTDAAFVIGNEAFGVRREVAEICDERIRIPMPGGAESLNAGVAAGVLIYESVRKSNVHEQER